MPLNIKLKEARKMEPQIDDLARKDPRIKEVLEVAERLEGMARNARVHAAGVVISPAPLKRPGSALQDQQGRNCHPVRHGGPGKTDRCSRWIFLG